MAKNNSWIVWLIAVIAIVALVLAIVALGKVNATGNSIFNFLKRTDIQNHSPSTSYEKGLLGNIFASNGGNLSKLKDYKVKYDENGNLIYEIINEGRDIQVGANYVINKTNDTHITIYLIGSNQAVGGASCGCPLKDNPDGKCTAACTYNSNGDKCRGTCTGNACGKKSCKELAISD